MQDPNPLPWGALDRYQAHFIVRKTAGSSAIHYTAKTILSTQGHFGSLKDATIYVEPTDTAIRIRSKWDNHIAFGITKELFEIYDRIAGHIKSI